MKTSLMKGLSIVCFIILACATACKDDGGGSGGGDDLSISVLGEGTATAAGITWGYQQLKIEVHGKEPAYALWIPALAEGARPAVLMTQPYDAIDWSGDSPADTPQPDLYYVEMAIFFLINGAGVLHVFNRYYAGGDIQNEVDDTVAGLLFLRQNGAVDTSRIGIHGGSWGGFEALYGAINAPEGALPAAGVAFFPVSDFPRMVAWITRDIPALVADQGTEDSYTSFFQPYLDRIYAKDGWEEWTADYLISRLATPFLIPHDEWDTLVPFEGSLHLAELGGEKIAPLWYLRGTPRDLNAIPYGSGHCESDWNEGAGGSYVMRAADTFAHAFLLTRIAEPGEGITIFYDSQAIYDFAQHLHGFKCVRGRQVEWGAARLRELADARITVADINPATAYPEAAGAELVKNIVNDIWGTSFTTENIREALASGLPACP